MVEKIFCEEMPKPELSEETLAHYGVKGMKWRRRKSRNLGTGRGTGSLISRIRQTFGKGQKVSSNYWEFDSAMKGDSRYERKTSGISKKDTRYYPKPGINTEKDPRYQRQGNGMAGDPRYVNKKKRFR